MRRSRSNRRAESAFQGLDLLRQRWSGDVQPRGGAAEVEFLGDGHKVTQLTEFHDSGCSAVEGSAFQHGDGWSWRCRRQQCNGIHMTETGHDEASSQLDRRPPISALRAIRLCSGSCLPHAACARRPRLRAPCQYRSGEWLCIAFGLVMLCLMYEVARNQPLDCLIDDER